MSGPVRKRTGLAMRDAGLDTIIFDGPGQGTALDAGIPTTPDWLLPVAAILTASS